LGGGRSGGYEGQQGQGGRLLGGGGDLFLRETLWKGELTFSRKVVRELEARNREGKKRKTQHGRDNYNDPLEREYGSKTTADEGDGL